jgi:PAP2 superfamily
VPFFGATFTNLKILIPAFQPFSWDPTFAEWDRWMHGGYHPWEWLQPLFGYPFVTSFINAVYHSWFFLAYGVLLWQATSVTRPRLRMQYLLTFLLIWALIGNAAAIMLSSAGPVYFGRVTGLPDPFAALMHYLNQARELAPVPALGVQEMLWRTYESKGIAFGGGISAMPSLHVAVAFSFFLLARAIDRRLAIAAGLFVALILIGSVHLGWHYALDGYLAIPMTWLIWRVVGWTLDRPFVRALQGLTEPAPVAADARACRTAV